MMLYDDDPLISTRRISIASANSHSLNVRCILNAPSCPRANTTTTTISKDKLFRSRFIRYLCWKNDGSNKLVCFYYDVVCLSKRCNVRCRAMSSSGSYFMTFLLGVLGSVCRVGAPLRLHNRWKSIPPLHPGDGCSFMVLLTTSSPTTLGRGVMFN